MSRSIIEHIRSRTPLYFLRATPFTDHGEFNYNGKLKEDFFFENLFSKEGKCDKYIDTIISSIKKGDHKTILLTGNQGCGKTTFIHYLSHINSPFDFLYFDFDENTSHPTLEEYIERLSNYFHSLINNDKENINGTFYRLYKTNKHLIRDKSNANNKIGVFFDEFYDIYISGKTQDMAKDNFILKINVLFFNQILTLIVLWHLAKQIVKRGSIRKIVFCLDNLDVLVNQDIIERFFKEYFRFVRNVDGIINRINDDYIRDHEISYNDMFAFILNCRQHTWARVKKDYPQDSPAIHVSILEKDITDAFEKRLILTKREQYIHTNRDFFGEFEEDLTKVRSILNDLDVTDKNPHSIYDLFNDDYRQCILTVEDIIKDDTTLIETYMYARKRLHPNSQGLRGIFYRSLFDWFKKNGVLREIGVLDVERDTPLVSNARLILNYLYYNSTATNGVPFKRIVDDFEGIIDKDDIDNSLVAMFLQGYKAIWNELIAFNEIDREEIDTCEGTDIMITSAGREYIDFIATHFEFFNTRVSKRRESNGAALFSSVSIRPYSNSREPFSIDGTIYHFDYLFEETIFSVMEIVAGCCQKMTEFYNNFMRNKYPNKCEYLRSPFVYGESGVLHGERIIHTHIRYIDNYRLYLLGKNSPFEPKKRVRINQKLTKYINEYIKIGEKNPGVLTEKSSNELFPAFLKRIKEIRESDYTDFNPINIKRS